MKKKKRRLHLNWALYLMLIPGFIYLLFNNYIPMTFTVIAFKKYNFQKGIWGSEFIGFDNFKSLFSTRDSWIILRNTVGYNLIFIAIGLFVGLAIAILLDELNSKRGKRAFQMTYLIPYMISITVVSYLAFAFLSSDNGFINNSILKLLGMDEISWYSSPKYWPFILTFIYLWKSFGYSSILYFATLIGIDDSYYEAAVIDGASTWQQIRHITLPCLKTTIITLVIMHIGRMFYSDFGLFYQVPMNNGLLFSVTNTIDTYVYRGLLQLNDVGRSSAAGFLQSILGFVLVMITNMITRKIDKESALF